jgi:hypothetical protein
MPVRVAKSGILVDPPWATVEIIHSHTLNIGTGGGGPLIRLAILNIKGENSLNLATALLIIILGKLL